jgi:hypothetical protein
VIQRLTIPALSTGGFGASFSGLCAPQLTRVHKNAKLFWSADSPRTCALTRTVPWNDIGRVFCSWGMVYLLVDGSDVHGLRWRRSCIFYRVKSMCNQRRHRRHRYRSMLRPPILLGSGVGASFERRKERRILRDSESSSLCRRGQTSTN